jgi:hypothetical protein
MLPITFRDALIHHLAVPRWWHEANRIYSIEWHEWSYYPMLLNLGFTGLFSLGLENFAASYHWAYAFLFSAVVAQGTLKLLNDQKGAAIAFFLSATIPVMHRISALPIVDCGLALWSALTLFIALEYIVECNKPKLLVFAGVALGLALGTKYNALPFAFSTYLICVLVVAKKSPYIAFKSALIIGLVSAATYSPWLIRNYSLTNNPIYPLYSNIFDVSVKRPSGLPSLKPIEQRILIYKESALEIALLPLRIFYQGKDDQPVRFDGVLTPIFILSLFGALFLKNKQQGKFAIMLVFLYLAISILSNPLRVRYLTPIFAALIFLSTKSILYALSSNKALKFCAQIALVAHSLLFINYASEQIKKTDLLSYLSGNLSRESYFTKKIPEYPLIEYVNKNISEDKTIYLLFTGNNFALYNTHLFSGGHYSASYLHDWIRQSVATNKPLISFFDSSSIDYLLTNTLQEHAFITDTLLENERIVWVQFIQKHLRLVYDQRGFSLWQVVQ